LENTRELFQIFVRRFELLNATCCDCCCGKDISLVQSHILYEIKRLNNPSMQEVAVSLGVDITTFSRQIKTLEMKGLVQRRPDRQDRRVNILSLTDEGRRVERQIDERMKGFIENILSQMTEFERDMVIRSIQLLNKVITNTGVCCIRE